MPSEGRDTYTPNLLVLAGRVDGLSGADAEHRSGTTLVSVLGVLTGHGYRGYPSV